MTKTINLHGHLAELCGTDSVKLVGDDIRILVSGLVSQFGTKVKQYMMQNNFHISVKKPEKDERYISEQELGMSLGDTQQLSIFPAVEGSGRTAMVIVGVVIFAAAVFFSAGAAAVTAGTGTFFSGGAAAFASASAFSTAVSAAGFIATGFMTMGMSMVMNGLLAPSAPTMREDPSQRASFQFNGPVNTVEQGSPVPVCYGRFKVGSVVVSSGMSVESIRYTAPIGGSNGGNGGRGRVLE